MGQSPLGDNAVMSQESATTYRESKRGAWAMVIVSFAICCIAFYLWYSSSISAGWAIGIGLIGLFFEVGALGVALSEGAPKLTVDEKGITDYQCGNAPRWIGWETIRSMDCDITKVNGSVKKAQVNLYVLSEDHKVEEVTINIAELNACPDEVYRKIKMSWIEFESKGSTQE